MLTALCTSTAEKVLARATEKSKGPFSCPACNRAVILNKGMVRAHHFKHEAQTQCPRGAGESEEHFACKNSIFDALSGAEGVREAELEKSIGSNIADVYAVIRGAKVAIEVQKSILTPQAIAARTAAYEREGIFVLWIGLRDTVADAARVQPKGWEKWCHAAFMGRVYFWHSGTHLRTYHYDSYSEFREERTIFQKGGIERNVGGYERFFKNARKPVPGPTVDLARDFRPMTLDAYQSKTLSIPRRRIFIDRHAPWW